MIDLKGREKLQLFVGNMVSKQLAPEGIKSRGFIVNFPLHRREPGNKGTGKVCTVILRPSNNPQ